MSYREGMSFFLSTVVFYFSTQNLAEILVL